MQLHGVSLILGGTLRHEAQAVIGPGITMRMGSLSSGLGVQGVMGKV